MLERLRIGLALVGIAAISFFTLNNGLLVSWLLNYVPPAEHYRNVKLHDSVVYVSAGRSEGSLKWLAQSGDQIALNDNPGNHPSLDGRRPVTVLVHGYNALEDEIGSYFDEVIEYFGGNVASAPAYVVFDWPSSVSVAARGGWLWKISDFFDTFGWDTYLIETNNYHTAKSFAEGVGSNGMVELVKYLGSRSDAKISIVAHSMGCLLVIDALAKDPSLASHIARLVLLAPAIEYDALQKGQTAALLAKIDTVEIYYSHRDEILPYAAFADGSPILGLSGPQSTQGLPANIAIHDVTDVLGEHDVHGRFLHRDGLRAIGLAPHPIVTGSNSPAPAAATPAP